MIDSSYVDPRKNDPRSVDELISVALSDPHTYDEGGWDAVVALHWRGTEEVLVRAARLCESSCAVERRIGADILGQLGIGDRTFSRQRLDVLVRILRQERDADVLHSVLIALGHLGEPDAVVPAARFCRHPDAGVRYAAVHAISGYDDPLAVNSLMELTCDEDSDVRDWATFGLGTQLDVDTPELRDTLAARIADPDEVVRAEALTGLARRKDARAIPPLWEELRAESVDIGFVEAAELAADPQLHSALLALRTRWDGDIGPLNRALAACTPRPDGKAET